MSKMLKFCGWDDLEWYASIQILRWTRTPRLPWFTISIFSITHTKQIKRRVSAELWYKLQILSQYQLPHTRISNSACWWISSRLSRRRWKVVGCMAQSARLLERCGSRRWRRTRKRGNVLDAGYHPPPPVPAGTRKVVLLVCAGKIPVQRAHFNEIFRTAQPVPFPSPLLSSLPSFFLSLRYDTIEEINVDSKAEYTP